MPPKRTASKRKAESTSDDESEPKKSTKKTKVAAPAPAVEGSLAPNGQPTNKVLPVNITFSPRVDGTVRISTWNICGLAAASKKGFKYYIEAEDPDIIVLTETKVNDEPVDPVLVSRFPHRYWSISTQKTYSGTAVLSKREPKSVTRILPGHPDPDSTKGRIVTLEFEDYYLIGTYVPNAGEKLKNLDARATWNRHFEGYIRDLDSRKPVIWTGDLNVAPTEIDLSNPKKNWNKTPGYTEEETSSFARILNPPGDAKNAGKFVDMWRARHPDERHYTYFSYRFNCRVKGIGWRLDTFVLSERIADNVKMIEIRSDIYGASDHCPVTMEFVSPTST
ncbi:unnamed protein product [Peniophora sp. CBMAI 1063]|nr:unnamed protein product [Peniophora sp. CBMAI 1063]